MVTSDEKKLLALTYAEYEGIGTWYEYLAKYRLFSRINNPKKVLLAGIPQEYGIAADTILFAIHGAELTVLDNRKEKLNEFKEIAKKFNAKVKTVLCKTLEKFPFKSDSFDIVVNTEAIQRVKNPQNMIQEMERVSKNHVFVFAPNAYYYAHYLITKIITFKLSELVKMSRLKLVNKGYLDRPPWPAGVAISSSKISFTEGSKSEERKKYAEEKNKDSFFISFIKGSFTLFTPLLVKLEILYPSPLRELLSHICFIHLKKIKN